MSKLVSVVRVEIGHSRMVVAVLSNRTDFAKWKDWFKKSRVLPGEEVVDEGTHYLIIKNNTGCLLSYDVTQTLLDPHMEG